MEIQVAQLIEQIKKEGVATAETEAKAIVDAAKADAEKIVEEAKTQASKLLSDAKSETERMTRSAEDAIRQSGRNLLISFRESVSRELKAVIGENVSAVYASESLSQLIVDVVANRANRPDAADVAVILNTEDLAKLEKTILAALKEKLLTGVTLKANDTFDGGFRIAVNNGSAYYDYSADAVVEMLSNYLSPKVTALLKEAK